MFDSQELESLNLFRKLIFFTKKVKKQDTVFQGYFIDFISFTFYLYIFKS